MPPATLPLPLPLPLSRLPEELAGLRAENSALRRHLDTLADAALAVESAREVLAGRHRELQDTLAVLNQRIAAGLEAVRDNGADAPRALARLAEQIDRPDLAAALRRLARLPFAPMTPGVGLPRDGRGSTLRGDKPRTGDRPPRLTLRPSSPTPVPPAAGAGRGRTAGSSPGLTAGFPPATGDR